MEKHEPLKVFYSYSHADREHRDTLEKHLKLLKRDGLISEWYDKNITAGLDIDSVISDELEVSDIILLLISPDFIASDYCYDIEVKRALEMHNAGQARVIPIILRACDWHNTPLSGLLALPEDGKHISKWKDTDEYFLNVNHGIRTAIAEIVKVKQNTSERDDVVKNKIEKEYQNILTDYPRPDIYFTGRVDKLQELRKAIDSSVITVINGLGGVGKTELVATYINDDVSEKEKILWLSCTSESRFDTFVQSVGYGYLLEGDKKTDKAKFSAFKDVLEREKKIVFWDNFQDVTDRSFTEFVRFAYNLLKDSRIVIICKSSPELSSITFKEIKLEGLEDNGYAYAEKLNNEKEISRKLSEDKLKTLCSYLKGHPLAIKMAMKLLDYGVTVEDIIGHIEDLNGISEVTELNERLFKQMYEHSETTENERKLLREFSVFKGKVDKEAIAAIYNGNPIGTLTNLVKKMLLNSTDGMYEMHPLIREFSYQLLEDKKAIHKRASDYFINQRQQKLSPALEEVICYHLMVCEDWNAIAKNVKERGRDFIQHGLLGLLLEMLVLIENHGMFDDEFNIFYGDIYQIKGDWNRSLQYFNKANFAHANIEVRIEGIIKCGEIKYRKSLINEANLLFEQAYELAIESNSKGLLARAENDLGLVFSFKGELDKSLYYLQLALEKRERLGLYSDVGVSLCNIGDIYEHKGDLIQALNYYERSLILAKEFGHPGEIATALNRIGDIYHIKGDIPRALDYRKRSLKLKEEIGDKQGIAAILGNIGSIYKIKGDLNEALDYYKRSLKLDEEIGNKQGIAAGLGNVGSVHQKRGDLDKALDYYNRSLKLAKEIGDRQGITVGLGNVGSIYQTKGDLSQALEYQEESLKIKKEIGDKQGLAAILGSIGNIYERKGDLQQASRHYEKGLRLSQEIGDKRGIAIGLGNLGNIWLTKQDLGQALDSYEKSLKLTQEIGDKQGTAAILGNIGRVYKAKGDLQLALKHCQRALELDKEIGDKHGVAISLGNIASIFDMKGDLTQALEYYRMSLNLVEEVGDKAGIIIGLVNIGVILCENYKEEFIEGLIYLLRSSALSFYIGLLVNDALSWIIHFRDKMEISKFKLYAHQAYEKLDEELKQYIDLPTICKEPYKSSTGSVGRNEPCPCGSGKKYKNCHGKSA